MGKTQVGFAKNVVAFGLTAALAFGGVPLLNASLFAPVAYADDAAALVAGSASGDVAESVTTFTFSDSGIEAAGETSGYKISGTDLTIQTAGTYTLTGSCADGSVAVKKGVEGVTLVLDNLTLSKAGDKAIKFKAGSSGTIVLVGENTLSTSGDKGIIKANAEADDNDNIVYGSDGSTTGGDLVITGSGVLNLSSEYSEVVDGETEGCDAINCEGDLTVLGGTFNIAVTDDGMHADNTLTIGAEGTAGPTIAITKANEGLEGATVNLVSGSGNIVTSDDGINAANKDLVSYGWQYGIDVAGGTWSVIAGGDGLDSNGNLTVSGGTTEVYCAGNGNGALDYGEGAEGEIRGAFTVAGGTLLAVGSDMPVTPSSGNYVMFGSMGQMGFMGQSGQMGQPGQMGQMGQQGQSGSISSQQGGQSDANGFQQAGGSVVTEGQAIEISADDAVLYQTVASASGTYALFASGDLADNAQVTIKNGDSQTTATVGASTAQQGQPGQQPGAQQGQSDQQTGSQQLPPSSSQNSQDGQQPADGQQPPAMPGQDGWQPTDSQQPPAMPGQNNQDGQNWMPIGAGEPGQDAQQPAVPDAANPVNTDSNTGAEAATGDDTTGSNNATNSTKSSESSAKTTTKTSTAKTKSKNTMKVTKKTKTLKSSTLKKKARTVKAITVKSAKGKVTYSKVSGSKYLTVNKSTGKITVRKGTPVGTYKIKVKVKAAGNSSYKAASKNVTVTVKVK